MLVLTFSFKPFFGTINMEKMKTSRYKCNIWALSKLFKANNTFLYIIFVFINFVWKLNSFHTVQNCLNLSYSLNALHCSWSNIGYNIKITTMSPSSKFLINVKLPDITLLIIFSLQCPSYSNLSLHFIPYCLVKGNCLRWISILSSSD